MNRMERRLADAVARLGAAREAEEAEWHQTPWKLRQYQREAAEKSVVRAAEDLVATWQDLRPALLASIERTK